jgi:hypothetical protein
MTITKRIETIEDLERIVEAQNESINAMGLTLTALGDLVRTQDAQIRAHGEAVHTLGDLVRRMDELVKADHELLQRLISPPAETGDWRRVN